MGISLMADIPYQAIVWRVEYIMQRYGQLNRAKIGRQVSASFGYGLNQELPQLVSELRQYLAFQQTQLGRGR